MQSTNTLIIGAGPAGLANAACLQQAGVDYLLLEKHPHIAQPWRQHYERLHLHTSKKNSQLPFLPFDPALPNYPAREAVVAYLEGYARKMNLQPVFNAEVLSLRRDNGHWIAQTAGGETYRSSNVIVATGSTHTPKRAQFEGLDSFPGTVLHSSEYRNGRAFAGQQVLVVGFGNSGCEQAIDLHEHGAHPALSVRSAVNVLPRDILGVSVVQLGLGLQFLPPKVVDAINAPLMRLIVGDITRLGLRKAADGPLEQIRKTGRIPLLDVGTIRLIREGHIRVFGDIQCIDGENVFFRDGKSARFDAIVLATGYTHELEKIMTLDRETLEDLKQPISRRATNGRNGLFFSGFYVSPNGMLREMGIEARAIARQIARQ